MATEFDAYLPLTDTQKKQLWEQAVFVFDTNVLIGLYRLGHVTRTQVIASLSESLTGRVWIPYHVAVEFYRNRGDQLGADKRRIEEAIASLEQGGMRFRETISQANLKEIGVAVSDEDLSKITESVGALCAKLQVVRDGSPDLMADDKVLNFVQTVIGNRIGPAPENQQALDDLLSDGNERYQRQIPPGFKDAKEKGDEPYVHNGIQYKRKFGDLIIWKQLLAATCSGNDDFKNVIFVTGERKEDWWLKNKLGHTVGPRVELRQEIMAAGARLFHMYHFSHFLERLSEYLPGQAKVEAGAIAEIQREETRSAELEVLGAGAVLEGVTEANEAFAIPDATGPSAGFLGFASQIAVENWLRQKYPTGSVAENKGFPDLLVWVPSMSGDSSAHQIGVEVITPRNPKHLLHLLRMQLPRAEEWQTQFWKGLLARPQTREFFFVVTIHAAALKKSGLEEWSDAFRWARTQVVDEGFSFFIGMLRSGEFIDLAEAK